MMTVRDVRTWLSTLADDDEIGVDDGGLCLETRDGAAYLEVGGLPEGT